MSLFDETVNMGDNGGFRWPRRDVSGGSARLSATEDRSDPTIADIRTAMTGGQIDARAGAIPVAPNMHVGGVPLADTDHGFRLTPGGLAAAWLLQLVLLKPLRGF